MNKMLQTNPYALKFWLPLLLWRCAKIVRSAENFGNNHMVKIGAVTAEDVQGVAQKYLQKEALSIVPVGDAGIIKRK